LYNEYIFKGDKLRSQYFGFQLVPFYSERLPSFQENGELEQIRP